MKKSNIGRPTKYTEKLGKEICSLIAEGKSVRSICSGDDMPVAKTIYNWLLDKDKETFLHQYETARNVQAETMFEELISIADATQGEVMRDRLRVDTRKWFLSKVLPKKFGDKQILAGPDDGPLQVTVIKYAKGDKLTV